MTIVGGFDVHRKQLTFDYMDSETGEVRSGQIRPATRKTLRNWLDEHCPGRGCGVRGGGLYRMAVCGRRTDRGWGGGASGRPRRDRRTAGTEETGQERSH